MERDTKYIIAWVFAIITVLLVGLMLYMFISISNMSEEEKNTDAKKYANIGIGSFIGAIVTASVSWWLGVYSQF